MSTAKVELSSGSTAARRTDVDEERAWPALEERLPARVVARLLGVKVETLAKWRYLGKGPRGWIRVSATLVTYAASEVVAFLAERAAKKGGEGR